ncbi:MAG: DUF4838 domain-containing protein [Planctomycetota bacterium]|jgi:hypothetical protein
MPTMFLRSLLGLILFCVVLHADAHAAPDEVAIAENGRAKLKIVVSAESGEEVRATAADLARYLQRMSGADFEVVEGTGDTGLVVGIPEHLSGLPMKVAFGNSSFERDHYRIVSNEGGLYLLGATPGAVSFAVWDLLHHFGYRYYFPSATWEVVPERPVLKIAVDRTERPDFINRSAPRGGLRRALRPWAINEWEQWQIRNRTKSSFVLSTGHAYDGILSRHKAEFAEHPEYLALRSGERGGNKFCISNPQLRELVVRDAVRQIEEEPGRDSVSLDPSDGGSWCECQACLEMGSISDRVIILANAAAEAINDLGHGEKYVGTYAYNYHSPPPTVKVHPNVVVSLATAFIKGDQTFDEMLTGWSRKADLIGIREYYGLPVWHQSMPGTGKAGRPLPLAETIRAQHAAGARFINAESDDAWGPNGLGYYLASRLLWDVDTPVEDVIDDFLANCFGEAQEPMREFYDFISSGPRQSDHMVGTMYRLLRKARQLTKDPQVVARIDSLVLYTRYVELYRKAEGQAGFDRVVNFLWRSRKSIMCDSIGMFWYLNRDARKNKDVTWIPGEPQSMTLPPERLRERGDEPFTEDEILALIEEGIRNHDVLDFTPLEFSDDLVPAGSALNLADVNPLGRSFFGGTEGETTTRGELHNYTWISDPPRVIQLQIKTGLIYDVRGPATVELAHRGPIGVEKVGFYPVGSAEVPEDREWHDVRFTARKKGLYRITLNERMTGSRVKWPSDLPRTVPASEGENKQVSGRHSWYFYVPRGTRVIGAYSTAGAGGLYNADGDQVLDFRQTATDYLSVKVSDGQDGKLWSVRALSGRFRLQNVPPFVAGTASDLLLPKEVVERDGSRRLN